MTNTRSIYNTQYIIYKHTNIISDKSYIGKSVRGIEVRWIQHLSDAKRRAGNSYFHNAIRKYEIDSWEHEVLFVSFVKDDEYLYEIEEELIKRYNTVDNGYNLSVGGTGFSSGSKNPNYGKSLSEETKSKISKSKKGENHPSFKGYYHTPWGVFTTKRAGQTELCGYDSIVTWCKNPDKVITKRSISHSKYLKSLKESPLSKTFKDLGFDFNIK